MTLRCALYDMVLSGRVVYVGSTTRPRQRLSEHKCKGLVPKDAKMRVVRWYDTVDAARRAEAKRIYRLQPSLNVQRKTTREEQVSRQIERQNDKLGAAAVERIREDLRRQREFLNSRLEQFIAHRATSG